MNEQELRKKFPFASDSFIKANADAGGAGPDTLMERPFKDDALGTHPRQERAARKLHIRFVSWRQRLCDPDNLSVKWLLDCLRFSGAIEGDEPDKITLEVRQEKVKLKSDERTEITIT